jgi:hypothetical protein
MGTVDSRVKQGYLQLRRKSLLALVAVLGLVPAIACGCASQSPPPPAPQQAARPANRYIYVSARTLPDDCYTNLGTVSVSRAFGDAAVDPDNSEAVKQLRAVALSKYPADVDAVINVQSSQNDVGTTVTVSGDAVRLEDSHTVKCAMRDAEKVMDSGAEAAGTGIGAADAGGLTAGSSGAMSAGVIGAAALGAYQVLQHEEQKQEQKAELRNTLDDQRHEIAQLLKQRSHLQQCLNEEVPLAACEASAQDTDQSSDDQSDDDNNGKDTVNATTFQIQKQIQEQQDYIKQLKDQIAQIKWDMGGHHQ